MARTEPPPGSRSAKAPADRTSRNHPPRPQPTPHTRLLRTRHLAGYPAGQGHPRRRGGAPHLPRTARQPSPRINTLLRNAPPPRNAPPQSLPTCAAQDIPVDGTAQPRGWGWGNLPSPVPHNRHRQGSTRHPTGAPGPCSALQNIPRGMSRQRRRGGGEQRPPPLPVPAGPPRTGVNGSLRPRASGPGPDRDQTVSGPARAPRPHRFTQRAQGHGAIRPMRPRIAVANASQTTPSPLDPAAAPL